MLGYMDQTGNLPRMPEPHDVADALAVALCHYYTQRLPACPEGESA